MVAVTHLLAPAAMPHSPDSLSVFSYNVLLPNSVDAWWTYKMYSPPLSESDRHVGDWEYRRKLIEQRVCHVDADVVCFQEVSPTSFESDFSFMSELGYDGVELFRKGRFRPATFWKTNKCKLAAPAAHKDRTLLTSFIKINDNEADAVPWFVLNCHLQAGKQGQRRVRQMLEGTKAIITMAKKLKVKEPETAVAAIVCGDFNGGSECGAVRLLEDGFIDSEFLEDGESVTSKRKDIPMVFPLKDVVTAIERDPPPTLVVPELISQMVQEGGNGYDNPILTESVVERLTKIYHARATCEMNGEKLMSATDVEKWLVLINGKLGRGDEYREAAKQMGWKPPPNAEEMSYDEIKKLVTLPSEAFLSLQGFLTVYQKELEGGKFWGINHDLTILGEPLDDCGVFNARFDRIYCTSNVQPIAVVDFEATKPCPNAEEPSDHLPVAACFTMK